MGRATLVVGALLAVCALIARKPQETPKARVPTPKSRQTEHKHSCRTHAATRPAPSNSQVRGRVIDPDGRPMGGVEVALAEVADPCAWPPPIPRRVRTSEDGAFAFDPPARAARLEASHPGFGPASAEAVDGAELRLAHPSYIDGWVSAPGASVRLVSGIRELCAVTPDEHGAFRVGPVPAYLPVTLAVSAPGYLPWSERQPVVGEGESLYRVVKLERGLAVCGTVEPATTGISVRATQGDGRDLVVQTDAEGRFEIGGLTPGAVRLIAWGEGYDVTIGAAQAGGRAGLALKRRTP